MQSPASAFAKPYDAVQAGCCLEKQKITTKNQNSFAEEAQGVLEINISIINYQFAFVIIKAHMLSFVS